MFSDARTKNEFMDWARREITRETHSSMISYQAARQALDVYEMRLEAMETRLSKEIRDLEARIDELETELDAREAPPEKVTLRTVG